MRAQSLGEGGFHFLKGHDRERDQPRTFEGQPRGRAGFQKFRQRQNRATRRSLLEDLSQTDGDAAGDKSITITPKVDPWSRCSGDLRCQGFADAKPAFTKALFADWILSR